MTKRPSIKTDFFLFYSFWENVHFMQMCWCEIFDKFEVCSLLLLFGGQVDTNVTALLNIFQHHRETSLSSTFKATDLWSLFLIISYLGDTAVLKGCVTFSKIQQKLPISMNFPISFKRCCHITRQHPACQFEHSVTSQTPPFLHDSPHNITLT